MSSRGQHITVLFVTPHTAAPDFQSLEITSGIPYPTLQTATLYPHTHIHTFLEGPAS
jgi:hypothetical protein